MRILLVCDSAGRTGGGPEVLFELAEQFTTSGHEVSVAVLSEGHGSHASPRGLEVSGIEFLGSGSLPKLVWRLRRWINQKPPFDVHHALGTQASAILALSQVRLARSSDQAVNVGSEHIWASPLYSDFPSIRGKFLGVIYRFAYRRLDAIICVSVALRDRLSAIRGMRHTHISFIPNPVKLAKRPVTKQLPHRVTALDPLRILSVGSLDPRKDPFSLLHAIEIVRSQIPCTLVMAGEGQLRGQLEELIDLLDLRSVVNMPGYIGDKRSVYRNADVFVLSSRVEGYPLVLVEALAMGLSIVSTDCPSGPAEFLRDGELGTLVPMGDPQALARGILEASASTPNAVAVKTALNLHVPERVAQEYLQIFRTLLARTSR